MPRISNNLTTHGGVSKDFPMFPKKEIFDKFVNLATETFFDYNFPPLPPSASNLDRIEREEERDDFRKSLLKYTNDRLLEDQVLVRKFINFVTNYREFNNEWLEFIEAYVGYRARPATPEAEEEAEAATTPIPTQTFHLTPAEMSLFEDDDEDEEKLPPLQKWLVVN